MQTTVRLAYHSSANMLNHPLPPFLVGSVEFLHIWRHVTTQLD